MKQQRKNNARPASDRPGDIAALGKNPPQVRAANQNGHPRLKDLQASDRADKEYVGGARHPDAPKNKQNGQKRLVGGQTRNAGDTSARMYVKPFGANWGEPGKDGGWVRIPMPDDNQIEAAMLGIKSQAMRTDPKTGRLVARRPDYVMGQRVGRFCTKCSLAIPKAIKTDICDECA